MLKKMHIGTVIFKLNVKNDISRDIKACSVGTLGLTIIFEFLEELILTWNNRKYQATG